MTRRRVAYLTALAGCLLIVAGVGLIFVPAGLIVAGALILVALFGPDMEAR